MNIKALIDAMSPEEQKLAAFYLSVSIRKAKAVEESKNIVLTDFEKSLITSGNLVEAIKAVNQRTKCGLATAKYAVEHFKPTMPKKQSISIGEHFNMPNKVKMQLVGLDGNAFNILGTFTREARNQGWTEDEIKKVQTEAMSGNYDHLLVTIMDNVEEPDEDDSFDEDEKD